jgi:hypothetical protein
VVLTLSAFPDFARPDTVGIDPADLAVTLAASPSSIVAGGRTTLTATVSNAGPGDAASAGFRLTLPAGAVPVSSKPTEGRCNSGAFAAACLFGTLSSGQAATATFVVQLSRVGRFSFTGNAAAVVADPVPGNNQATTSVESTRLTATDVIKLPSSRTCVSKRKIRVRLRRPDGIAVERVKASVNGKIVKSGRFTSVIKLKGLPRGTVRVKIVAETDAGRRLTAKRTYHTCQKRRRAAS